MSSFFLHLKFTTKIPNMTSSSSSSHSKEETLEKSQIQHFLHEQHPLILFENVEELPRCGICFKKLTFDGPVYGCWWECYFYVHKSCVDELPQQQVRKMDSSWRVSEEETPQRIQIEHIHGHPLRLLENVKKQPGCMICYNKFMLDGPMYGCVRCSFYVHKSCGELPKQVRNMLHPKHLLELSRSHGFGCNACGENFHCSSYKCKPCDFDLDVGCVLEEHLFEEPQGHKEHRFNISKPLLFTCDACGIEEVKSCISCICKNCQLQAHKKCTNTYPFTIKEPRHTHSLKLTYSFQTDSDFSRKICKICFNKINDVLFMYCCVDCDFFTHVKCGVSTNTLCDDGRVLEIEDKVSGHNTLESKEPPQQQVQHFSHPHLLTININGPNSVILCNGCVLPISELFYSCDKCNFFLHRRCVELKEKIQHSLHEHELTLVSVFDGLHFENRSIFRIKPGGTGIHCYGCGFTCNGFMYKCEECSVYLDIGCSLLLDISKHEGHTHVLTLIDTYKRHKLKSYNSDFVTKCNACGSDCLNKFVCEGCNFNLDLQCASLPKLVPHQCPKHDWNLHNFELMYEAIEDGRSGKHYCDVCEEERSESHWFYYCQDCDYSSHPRCILGEDRVKYGSLYKLEGHPHFVCFLKAGKENRTCKICLEPCEKGEFVFTCKECDTQLHYYCYVPDEM